MGTWFWLNIPLALLFVGCWAGIPLWHTLTRWNAEISAQHAEISAQHGEIAAETRPAPVSAQPGPAVAHQTASSAYAGVANALGR